MKTHHGDLGANGPWNKSATMQVWFVLLQRVPAPSPVPGTW